jgi:DGQHR domain-containing protein
MPPALGDVEVGCGNRRHRGQEVLTSMDHMTRDRIGTNLLVQRGRMGGREVFTAVMTLRELNSLVPPRPESGPLGAGREQRLTDEEHAYDIAVYLTTVEDYYLPGVMAFLHERPEFRPLTDDKEAVFADRVGWLWVDGQVGRSLGDGMHRGIGIQSALGADEDGRLADDHIVVSFVVEPDKERRRQLFNDINRTQKRVAKSLAVSYDQRDPIARAVNKLVEEHPFGVLVEREKPTAGRRSGKLVTTGTLYDAVAMIIHGWSGKPGRRGRPPTEDEALEAADLLMKALTSLPEVEDVLEATDPGEEANRLRERSILGSGATVKALAGALFVAKGRTSNGELPEALERLHSLNWDPKAWVDIGFVTEGGRTPSSRTQEVRAAGLRIADQIAPVDDQ